jgi:hypothetical protein
MFSGFGARLSNREDFRVIMCIDISHLLGRLRSVTYSMALDSTSL